MALARGGESERPERCAHDRVGIAVFVATAVAVYARLFYAVDLTDDAFYTALPYSFALGHRPLADELAAHQFAGILLLPLFKAYLGLVGSHTGIVLFARHLYFGASLAAALVARHTLSATFGSRAGSFAGALALAYIPFLLPALSYNAIACLAMLAGTMLLAAACMPGKGPSWLVGGTACVATASFAYPPVIIAAAMALGLTLAAFWRVREPAAHKRALVATLGTGALAASAGLATIFHFGTLDDLRRLSDANEALAYQGGGFEKGMLILQEAWLQLPYLLALALTLLGVLACIGRFRNAWLAAGVAALMGPALLMVAAVYKPWREPFTTAPFVLIELGLLAPVALRLLRRKMAPHAFAGLTMVAASSFLCALVILWATANGLRNAALGLLPASLVTFACIGLLRPSETRSGTGSGGSGFVYPALAISLIGFQVAQVWTQTYRDSPIAMLNTKIERGAWAGIYTSEGKARFVEDIIADVQANRGEAQTVLFTDYFPGGYLLSDLRPRTPALWLFPWNDVQQGTREMREVYASELSDDESFPDLLVRIKCLPVHTLMPVPQRAGDPLALRLLEGGYAAASSRPCYDISRRRRRR
ncbi:MAG: hypothetical protein NZ990_13755 [Myxococcota bacterium]|nr:hypothetical protein [Myxococcota bacterium]